MRVVWTQRALKHLIALRDYIAADNPGAAAVLTGRIIESVNRLEQQPHSGRPGRIAGTRELVVPNTAYIIPYRVRGEGLELLAVFHGRQKWPKRL
jgi:toxin ParE1/3/4